MNSSMLHPLTQDDANTDIDLYAVTAIRKDLFAITPSNSLGEANKSNRDKTV